MSSRAKGWILATLAAAVLASAAVGWALYQRQRTIVVDINGILCKHYTREANTQTILTNLGIRLQDGDIAELTPRQELAQGAPLRVHVARPMLCLVDGKIVVVLVGEESLGGALERAGVALQDADVLLLAGKPFDPADGLANPEAVPRQPASEVIAALRQPVQATILRARRIEVDDGDAVSRSNTRAATVGHALHSVGVTLYAGDESSLQLAQPLDDTTMIEVKRSLSAALDVGGEPRLARTCADSIQELLAQEGVAVGELDYVRPEITSRLVPGALVQVVRVLVERYVEEIPVAFEERWEPDPNIDIDQREIKAWGREGAERRLWQVRYENDVEVDRVSQEQWTAREPIDRVIHYGTRITLRELDTPSGTITYWRKVRMLATSYNAPTAGKPMDHPTYGITRMGLRARKGIIAVDPRIIPLGTDLYVPGYGPCMAGDTGGAILWRRIDLCFDDDNLELWKKWVDVYFLAPVPDESEITWVITNWPRERD